MEDGRRGKADCTPKVEGLNKFGAERLDLKKNSKLFPFFHVNLINNFNYYFHSVCS
jgi:hypothetical protein